MIAEIGNLVPDDVPVSKDEKFNGKVKKWGNLRINENNKLRHHHELLYMIGMCFIYSYCFFLMIF